MECNHQKTNDLRHVLLPLFKNRKCGSKVAAEMGYFKPFSHLVLCDQQPVWSKPIHYDFSTA